MYCPFCGVRSIEFGRDVPITTTTCPFCFSADEFSKAFCTVCGAQINQAEASVRLKALNKRTGFNWSVPSADTNSPRLLAGTHKFPTAETTVPIARPRKAPTLLYAIPGVVVGVLGAVLVTLFYAAPLNFLLARYYCPNHGLAVAVQLPNRVGNLVKKEPAPVDVTVENVETKDRRNWKTDADGLLTVPQIDPGRYRVTMQAPGYEVARTIVSCEKSRPTYIGFPNPVVLPPSDK